MNKYDRNDKIKKELFKMYAIAMPILMGLVSIGMLVAALCIAKQEAQIFFCVVAGMFGIFAIITPILYVFLMKRYPKHKKILFYIFPHARSLEEKNDVDSLSDFFDDDEDIDLN